MNEFLVGKPFDMYQLQLFRLVAEKGSFTAAGHFAGLSQSAVTRQIQGIERRLGIPLFERTTRRIRLTEAGRRLLERSGILEKEINRAIRELDSEFRLGNRLVRVGIARTIGLSYLPGFFHRFQRNHPGIMLRVSQDSDAALVEGLVEGDLDPCVIPEPGSVPEDTRIARSFTDSFALVAAEGTKLPPGKPVSPSEFCRLYPATAWLLLDTKSTTGRQIREWLRDAGKPIEPSMEADNFDLIVNLVGLGLGASLVPKRAVPLYHGRRKVVTIPLDPPRARQVTVLVRTAAALPPRVEWFVNELLFGG